MGRGGDQKTVLELSELAKLLAGLGSIELEDVIIRAKKIVIKPLGRGK